jgi:hypothetical protein
MVLADSGVFWILGAACSIASGVFSVGIAAQEALTSAVAKAVQ